MLYALYCQLKIELIDLLIYSIKLYFKTNQYDRRRK